MANTNWTSFLTLGNLSLVQRRILSRKCGGSVGQVVVRLLFFETSSARLSSGLIGSKKLETLRSSMILSTLHYRGLVYDSCYRYADHLQSSAKLRPDDQLAVGDIAKFAFIVEGAETIARSISRYTTFEQIYLGHDTTATGAVKGLEEALVRLYAAILVYLGKAKKYFEEPTPSKSNSHICCHIITDEARRTHGQSRGNVSK